MICPVCGADNTIQYTSVEQYGRVFKVNKDGKISRRSKLEYIGPEEWGIITCSACGAYWTDQGEPCAGFEARVECDGISFEKVIE